MNDIRLFESKFWIEILNFKARSYRDILRINGSEGEKRENYRIKFYKRFEKMSGGFFYRSIRLFENFGSKF